MSVGGDLLEELLGRAGVGGLSEGSLETDLAGGGAGEGVCTDFGFLSVQSGIYSVHCTDFTSAFLNFFHTTP